MTNPHRPPPNRPIRKPGTRPRSSGRTLPKFGRRSAPAQMSWRWIALLVGGGGLLLGVIVIIVQFLARDKPTAMPNPTQLNPSATSPIMTPEVLQTPLVAPTEVMTAPATPIETGNGTAVIAATPVPPDIPALQQLMLTLINDDRRANGLSELAWDRTAARAGQEHAQEMAHFGYLSHWNLDGYGPDYRYTLVGGLDTTMENVYTYQHNPSTQSTSLTTWSELIRQAQQELMKSSGHRANILDPQHTHVGVGIAYEPATGWLAIAQEFADRYVTLQPVSGQVSLGETVLLVGKLESRISQPLLNLAYEPFPPLMTVTQLKATNVYSSPARNYQAIPLSADDQGLFEQNITLNNNGQPGLYHLRIWGNVNGKQVLANDVIVKVQ